MSEVANAIHRKELDLLDIPFRVVLDILKFHRLYIIPSFVDVYGELFLFGYFTRDRFRMVFFLFPCVELVDLRLQNEPICFDVTKLIDISLHNIDQEYIRLLQVVSTKMSRFENLEVSMLSSYHDESGNIFRVCFNDLFLEENCFPCLKKLTLYSDPDEAVAIPVEWKKASHVWNKLEKLCLDCIKLTSSSFFAKDHLVNIAVLELHSTEWPDIELHLPKLREVSMDECREICIVPGNAFIYLRACNCDEETTVKKILKHVNYTIDIRLKNTSPRDCNYDFLFLFPKGYRYVALFDLQWSPFEVNQDEKAMKRIPSFGRDVECIGVQKCPAFHEGLMENEYPKLRELRLAQVPFRCSIDVIYPSFRNLLSIEFKGLPNMKDRVFRNHTFEKLEVLKLVWCDNLSGESWTQMPRLRDLRIEGLLLFDDTFFQEQKSLSKTLYCLRVKNCGVGEGHIRGKGWRYLEALRKFDFHGELCREFWKNKPFCEEKVIQTFHVEINSTGCAGEFVDSEISWAKNVMSLREQVSQLEIRKESLMCEMFDTDRENRALKESRERLVEICETQKRELMEMCEIKKKQEDRRRKIVEMNVQEARIRDMKVRNLEKSLARISRKERVREEKLEAYVLELEEKLEEKQWKMDERNEETKRELVRKKLELVNSQVKIERMKKKKDKKKNCGCSLM